MRDWCDERMPDDRRLPLNDDSVSRRACEAERFSDGREAASRVGNFDVEVCPAPTDARAGDLAKADCRESVVECVFKFVTRGEAIDGG